jgi:hypothetical protein
MVFEITMYESPVNLLKVLSTLIVKGTNITLITRELVVNLYITLQLYNK